MHNPIPMKDINGQTFYVDMNDLSKFEVLGMSISTILALQLEYVRRNGKFPMTEAFSWYNPAGSTRDMTLLT